MSGSGDNGTSSNRSLDQAQQQIEFQRDQAEAQALLADETSKFLITLLESASPLASKGEAIDLNDVLQLGEKQLEFGLQQQPRLKAKLLSTFASIEHNLGNTPKALDFYRASAALFASNHHNAEALTATGQQALMSLRNGEVERAAELIKAVDTISNDIQDSKALAWHLARKATIAHELGKQGQAIELLNTALADLERNNIHDPELLGRLHNELSVAYAKNDDNVSLQHIQKALKYAELVDGKMHPSYQGRLLNMSVTLTRLERYDEAKATLFEAQEGAEKLYTSSHPRYARVLSEQAMLWHDLGEFEQAEAAYARSLEIFKQTYGPRNRDYVRKTNNLAYLYEDMGSLSLAEPPYRESVRRRQELDPNNHMQIASAQGNLARLLTKTGNYQQSERLLSGVMETYADKGRSNLYNHLTQAANSIGDGNNPAQCTAGLEALERLTPDLKKQSAGSWRRMRAELWIGELAMRCGESVVAKAHLDAALEKAKKMYKPGTAGQRIMVSQINDILQP